MTLTPEDPNADERAERLRDARMDEPDPFGWAADRLADREQRREDERWN